MTWLQVFREWFDRSRPAGRGDSARHTLVSIMTANNETGVIQPMAEIAARCRKRGVLLHSDMVQSFGKLADRLDASRCCQFRRAQILRPERRRLSFISAPGIPIERNPIRRRARRRAPARDGECSRDCRDGGGRAKKSLRDLPNEQEREAKIARRIVARDSRDVSRRAAKRRRGAAPRQHTQRQFPGFSSETMLMALDLEGVCASSGSACMVGSVVASHVLLAMGLSAGARRSAIRSR